MSCESVIQKVAVYRDWSPLAGGIGYIQKNPSHFLIDYLNENNQSCFCCIATAGAHMIILEYNASKKHSSKTIIQTIIPIISSLQPKAPVHLCEKIETYYNARILSWIWH